MWKRASRSGPGWTQCWGAALLLLSLGAGAAAARPLHVVASVPDLGDLAREIGGEEVELHVFTKGPQDPHFLEARPSFIRTLHDADLFIVTGLDLEIGWAPVLLRNARNPQVNPGGAGYLDASTAIQPLDVPQGRVDRTLGDVHPYGNPHYLTDPINGLRVADLIRDKLCELRPQSAEQFGARYRAFERRLVKALVGPELVLRYAPAELASRVARGDLFELLEARGESELLGGWLRDMRPHRGTKVVQDHQLWSYFARRFGLVLVDTLEPRPGIAPTTRHLAEVVSRMQAEKIPIILSTVYFDPRHARWVAERTGARIVEMAHQVAARAGTDDYLAAVDHNVRGVRGAL